ncbi:velvet factor-domain-containing protein [Polychytrium aggregatum]|uniref:velvet factor-domain-containing protein n=1 Tax=Polychytrium aggregatum TaxID=110093 RepID=UPI0022FDF7C2|nr:velvet factor-domain-containing protein [Polychytrium aggregatum]KAI9206789.1 velvet factor-domain-containing protein [Polychytrium aggregatum]
MALVAHLHEPDPKKALSSGHRTVFGTTESPNQHLSPGWADSELYMSRLLPYAQHSLFGALISPSIFAKGVNGTEAGIYFVFGALFIRVEGTYRLMFDLVDLSNARRSPSSSCRILASILSTPLVSHGWKAFPGMGQPSSTLRDLVKQGTKVTRKHSPEKSNCEMSAG